MCKVVGLLINLIFFFDFLIAVAVVGFVSPYYRYSGWAYTLQPQSVCMLLNHLWGISLRPVALYFGSGYRHPKTRLRSEEKG